MTPEAKEERQRIVEFILDYHKTLLTVWDNSFAKALWNCAKAIEDGEHLKK